MDPQKKAANLRALGVPDDVIDYFQKVDDKPQVLVSSETSAEGKKILRVDFHDFDGWHKGMKMTDPRVEVSLVELKLILGVLGPNHFGGLRIDRLDDLEFKITVDSFLDLVKTYLPNIRSLHCEDHGHEVYAESLGDEEKKLLSKLPFPPEQITSFTLEQYYSLDREIFEIIPMKMPRLRELVIKCVGPLGALDHVNENLTDEESERLQKLFGGMITSLTSLESLVFHHANQEEELPERTKNGLKEAILSHPNLKNLEIGNRNALGFDAEEKDAIILHLTNNRVKPYLPEAMAMALEQFDGEVGARHVANQEDNDVTLDQACKAIVAARFNETVLYELFQVIHTSVATVAAENLLAGLEENIRQDDEERLDLGRIFVDSVPWRGSGI